MKFSKDMKMDEVVKATHKFVFAKGATKVTFNEHGLITEHEDYLDMQDFQKQLQGSTQREFILQSVADFLNGKVPYTFISHFLSENFRYDSLYFKGNAEGYFEHIKRIRTVFPDLHHTSNCSPSSTDFDLWICNFEHTFTVLSSNPFGLPKGRTKHQGIFSVYFDSEGKIERVEIMGAYHLVN